MRIRVVVSGVNPTDWKSRSGAFGGALAEPTVPNHDGAGIVDAVGARGRRHRRRRPRLGDARRRRAPGERDRPGVHRRAGRTCLPAPGRRGLRARGEHRDPGRHRPPRAHGRGGRPGSPAAGCAQRPHRARRRRGRGGRQRGDPAGPLGRRDGHRHRQQRGEGSTGRSSRRPPRRQLPRRRTPPTRSVGRSGGRGRHRRGRGGFNAELDQSVLKPRGTIADLRQRRRRPVRSGRARQHGLNARYQFVLLYTVGWDRIAGGRRRPQPGHRRRRLPSRRAGRPAGSPLRPR